METRFISSPLFLLSISVVILALLPAAKFVAASNSVVGINYGQIANNLPPPEKVVPLFKSIGVNKVKLYDADPRVLKAFANTGIEFVVGLGNEYLATMKDQAKADAWVKTNVQCYLPATKITCITIGNEVLTFNDTSLTNSLLPAMQNIHTALVTLGLDKKVTVTTAHSLGVLETSYPPSSGAFRKDLRGCVNEILKFHADTGYPVFINAYPFFAYKANPKITLDYVLFQQNQGIVDPNTNLHYDNMLFAQLDAVHQAMTTMGYKRVQVLISETGWPSKGDENEVGASPENAMKYNNNLMKLLSQKKGTPMRPNCDLSVYVFAMFNENLKPGPLSERNYGLFKPDGTPAYQLSSLTSSNSGSSTSSGSHGNNNNNNNGNSTSIIGGTGGEDGGPASYLSFSSSTKLGHGSYIIYFQVMLFACVSYALWRADDSTSRH